jgi:predicted RNase H-like HicB family nuclease
MSKPNYRVIVMFDGERKLFVARAPELEHCTAEGATRAEAIGKVEEEIDAQLANMLSHGSTPPRATDEEVFTGEVAGKISKTLHRDLTYTARSEGIEIDQLVGELLASALESRKHTQRGPRGGNRQPNESIPHDNIGNRQDGGNQQRSGGGGGFRGGRGYAPQILDDRANFIEYVRGLENNGGFPQRGGGGPGGPGGGHGGHDRGRRGRGRGRGPGGGGGPGGDRGNGGPRPQQHSQQRNGNGQQNYPNRDAAPQAAAPAAPPPPNPGGSGEGDGNS